jgi:hypothetical protein
VGRPGRGVRCEIRHRRLLGRPPSGVATGSPAKAGGRHGAAKAELDRCSSDLLILGCHVLPPGRHPTTPKWAYAQGNGWAYWSTAKEPTAEPVLYRGQLMYLDDAGDTHDFEEVGA